MFYCASKVKDNEKKEEEEEEEEEEEGGKGGGGRSWGRRKRRRKKKQRKIKRRTREVEEQKEDDDHHACDFFAYNAAVGLICFYHVEWTTKYTHGCTPNLATRNTAGQLENQNVNNALVMQMQRT